ncbi:hypothetical protein J18TS1_30920 [Oceanobacillus oncorhynchi subsp. incaldanensis]|uniref:Uncharacterized protein n=2 Tax=Oceanobacillus TaxID=182709 RepID=A0ABV9K3V8_9BACI|nr:hypothetical protein [Oceanobacillus oncorhynchi]MDM8099608.1 hypothetical protein [Oceanobacillus oncorhynchi]UUI41939.1 hypothetical protein NP440_10605 [Oceanobacillus oncorhynchi]GIO19992.1 hypothetical protein J18TS1_30920 [Oceanobacillus oncorhynchi subsp. incaldanensis]
MKKDTLNIIFAIIVCTTIITIGSILAIQINNNHKANELIIEKCMENLHEEESVTLEKEGLWSPVVCEK